jgi:uncharacterized membrane protein
MAAQTMGSTSAKRVREVGMEEPWNWLAAGWRDLCRAPQVSLAYGLIFAAVSVVITVGLVLAGVYYLVLPAVAGFVIVGPLLCVGLYQCSRRLEAGEPVSLVDVLKLPGPTRNRLSWLGVILMLILLAWMRIATLLYALFFGYGSGVPTPSALIDNLLFTVDGLIFLAVGTFVGGVLAFIVFAVSAVSVPLLLDRDENVVEAVMTSLEAVRRNTWTMLLWAYLIAVFIAAGLVTLYIGLIVTLPLIGHATWHAYRALIED